uniref:Uncharacterized protein n=1 Tax=Utricularia reniformis TaxID=192314 RepID=A0A1Y0B2E2_9LAMI|nr:hypothetical protein AEK19_MT1360 [Utricularia reniformis]ART31558.1 hypothetical protein AEK19_MT1360 [Utricularia reniformis]
MERKESPIDDRVEERADSSDKPRRRGQSQVKQLDLSGREWI